MAAADEHAVVELPGGRIRGFFTEDGQVFRARGIKYATADRFREPRLIDHWDEWDCTKPAVICPQLPSRLAAVLGDIQNGRPQSEDCLHVSIATPASAIRSKESASGDQHLPVMVFFHGGAYVTGGGDLDCYAGTPLAEHGVVVVNVNYRLGILSYFDGDTNANLGLLDQIAALKWVQSNVAGFGGDAGNVTVFGQSAGGDSIFIMLCIKETDGLFHRAILQSAPFGARSKPFSEREKMNQQMNDTIIHCKPADLDKDDLIKTAQIHALKAASGYSTGLMAFGPSTSRDPLKDITEAEASLDDISRIDRPVMISYTRDDGVFFAKMDPSGGVDPSQLFASGAHKLYDQIKNSGGQATLVYFSHRFQEDLGAPHCVDLPYLLGSWSAWKQAPMLHGPNAKDIIERVGPEVRKLWVSFARGSNPNLPGQYFEVNESFRFE